MNLTNQEPGRGGGILIFYMIIYVGLVLCLGGVHFFVFFFFCEGVQKNEKKIEFEDSVDICLIISVHFKVFS